MIDIEELKLQCLNDEFINIEHVAQFKCRWNVMCGSRQAGKTTAILLDGLEAMRHGKTIVYIRRGEDEIAAKKRKTDWDFIISQGWLEKIAGEIFPAYRDFSIKTYGGYWTLQGRSREKENAKLENLYDICQLMSLDKWLEYKGPPYTKVWKIHIDEFIDPKHPLADEVDAVLNMVSTIDRGRGLQIFLYANTISRSSPILDYMGINLRSYDKPALELYDFFDMNPITKNREKNSLLFWFYGAKNQTEASRTMAIFKNKRKKESIVEGMWDHEDYKKLAQDDVARMIDVSPDAYRLCKEGLTLYMYELPDRLYVTDTRVKSKYVKFEYITIYDGVTDEFTQRYNFNCDAPEISEIIEGMAVAESRGQIYFNNDLTGQDFSDVILETAHIKDE